MKMKRITAILIAAMLLLALAGCGSAAVESSSLSVDSNGENQLTVTAENAKTDNVCITALTVGENEEIAVEADFADSGEIIVRFAPGEYDAETFPQEPSALTVVGEGTAAATADPGVYTIAVSAGRDGLNGTAKIFTRPATE
jgi:preprotein translocase subunit SecF